MSIQNIINKVYEKLAYHVIYTINEDGVIVKEVKNDKFDKGRTSTVILSLLLSFLFVFVVGLTAHELKHLSQEKLFQESFYVNQLCFKGDELSECYNISHQKKIKIYLDERDGIKTLFISGE